MRVMRGLIVLLAILLVLTGCKEKAVQKPESTPAASPKPPAFRPLFPGGKAEDIIKNLILRYNELLAFGYQNLNMNFLQEVATVNQAEKAYHHMAALGEGKVRMISRLSKIDFDNIVLSGSDKAVVRTTEIWDFAYTDIKTGEKKEEKKDFVYLMTYTVEKKNGKWLITDIAAADSDNKQPKPASRR